MIRTYEEILKAGEASLYSVERVLFLRYSFGGLRLLARKFKKGVVLLSREEFEEFLVQAKRKAEADEKKREAGKLGGRPKLPDLTQDEIDKLPSKERLRYMQRIWKRQNRENKKWMQSN